MTFALFHRQNYNFARLSMHIFQKWHFCLANHQFVDMPVNPDLYTAYDFGGAGDRMLVLHNSEILKKQNGRIMEWQNNGIAK